ncbi:MAG: NAD(+) synthase, partial [Chloroflexi bacterium]|nr:NAD(+) synthase [Chloroflexota bacterium]
QIGEVYSALVLGLGDLARKNNIRRGVLGISGGIDSAVTAVLAAESLGAGNVTGIAIPSRFTDRRSTENARLLAARLGIHFEVVEMEEIHRSTLATLPAMAEGLPAENIQARIRMMILMAFVNLHGGMLVNTSNKTELALGYSTLYGDMAGTISPLGDLTKLQVYDLARFINRIKEVIPSFCLERPPSAELRPGQIDPFDYDILAPQVESLVQGNLSNDALKRSEHKRQQMGIILKVSGKAFGSGRMMPVTRR